MTTPGARPRRPPRRWCAWTTVAVLALGTTACSTAAPTAPAPSQPRVAAAAAAAAQTVVQGRSLARTPRSPAPVAPPAQVAGAPLRVVVPRLGVDAPVVGVAAPGGVLTPPADPQQLGWWSAGAVPGARQGSALVTGHTVHSGGGALDDLERLSGGDEVQVVTDAGRISYAVDSTEVLGKGELARRAPALFDQSVPGRLVLITCEDWNGVVYLSNVVVTASPAR